MTHRVVVALGFALGSGTVALVAMNLWFRAQGTAVTRKDKSDLIALDSMCEAYARDHDGAFPPDLETLVAQPQHWRGGKLPLDPWRLPYLYAATDAHCLHPRIWTYDRDGVPGGHGEDADLDNWRIHADMDEYLRAEAG